MPASSDPSAQLAPGRVLHVLKVFRPDFSGEGVFLERSSAVMHALAPQVAHEVLVTVTPASAGGSTTASTLARVHYLLASAGPVWRREIALVTWMLRHVRRFDTVHFRTHADWYFLSYIVVRLAGRRLVLSATLDDSVPTLVRQYRPMLQPLVRRLFTLFDDFISISQRLQDETSAIMPPVRCHLLPIGVLLPASARLAARPRAALRAELGIPPSALVLVFVGGLCARKDPGFLIAAWPALRIAHPECCLVLVGPPLEADYVAGLHAQARLTGAHVIFVGEVPDAAPWFDAADIMVFASRLEGFGTVVTEAMAHGLPVVARRLPGVNESFLIEGETGYAFTDQPAYVAAILRLADDAELRRRIGQQARARVAAAFDLNRIARRYLDIYGFSTPAAAGAPEPWSDVLRIGTGVSLLHPRFHQRAPVRTQDQPVVITMIDAEESFDWSAGFSRAWTDVRSMQCQGPAQRIFERHGVVPVYAVDWPVVSQDAGRAPLRELLAAGQCDIGAQLHSWVTPPFEEAVSVRNSFACNLPPRLEYAKLLQLTDGITEAFGVPPRIHRSGRYGISQRSGDMLRHLGYLVDSSVVPHWTFRDQDGPDFRTFDAQPYWADGDHRLLEIPLTSAVVGRLSGLPSAAARPLRRVVLGRVGSVVGLASIAATTGLLERIKLTPEGNTIAEMQRLVRAMVARGQRVFMLTYHTPSLQPGNTPYVRTPADLDRFLARLDAFYAFFAEEIGGRPARWRDVYDALQPGQAPKAAPLIQNAPPA